MEYSRFIQTFTGDEQPLAIQDLTGTVAMNLQKSGLLILALIVSAGLFLTYGSAALANSDLATGRISGSVWQDSNNNAIRELDELPLVEHPVYLQRIGEEAVGTMVAVIYTDEDGTFVFNNLEHGQYQVFADDGDYVLVDVSGVNASATIELPVPVKFHQIFLPMTVR
jgi:hypothetical protein